ELVGQAEVRADLVEEPPRRPREVVAIGGQAKDRRLAGIEHLLLVRASGRIRLVLHHARGELAVDRATEVVHPCPTPSGSSYHPSPPAPDLPVLAGRPQIIVPNRTWVETRIIQSD